MRVCFLLACWLYCEEEDGAGADGYGNVEKYDDEVDGVYGI